MENAAMTAQSGQIGWKDVRPIQLSVFDEPGVYRVRWLRDSQPVHPGRFLGRDDLGIIAIGKAKQLEDRRSQFVRAAETRRGSHSEGKLLGILVYYSALPANILGELHWEYRICDVEDLEREESLEIKRYVLRFGQTPPLNCAIPDRFGEWPGQLSLM